MAAKSPRAKSEGPARERATLDSAHVGDIQGAFGTIREHDIEGRRSVRARRALTEASHHGQRE